MLEKWGIELIRADNAAHPYLVYRERETHLSALISGCFQWADREHLIQGDRRVNFGEFYQLVAGKSDELRKVGVQRGSKVLLFAWNSIDWVASFWAVLACGGTVVLGNAWWSKEELQHAVGLIDPRLILVDKATASRVEDSRAHQIAATAVSEHLPTLQESDENDPALILFTSGTTGLPKAVVLSHRALIAGLHSLLHGTGQLPPPEAGFSPDVGLWSAPLFHIGGVQALLKAQVCGGTIVFTKGRFDPEEVLELIEAERVNRWFGVPTMYSRVINHPRAEKADLSSLKSLNIGAAPVSTDMLDRIRKFIPALKSKVSTGYGLTEAGGAMTVATGKTAAQNPGSSGAPLPGVEIKIAEPDASGQGEILVRSPSLMDGYLGENSSGPVDEEGWLHTGDLGKLVNGFLYITGRSKDLIIRGGENIAPAMVEAAIMALAGVRDVAVVGLPDPELGEVVGAAVVTTGSDLTERDIAQHLAGKISSFAVPTRWWIRETLPLNDMGKVDKKLLRAEWPAESSVRAEVSDDMSVARITDAMVENMRSRIGTQLRIDNGINNEECTRISVVRFTEGIGDDNPLWTDSEYASTTYLKTPIAPPSWVLCCFSGAQFGWPGLGAFHSSSKFRFHKIVRKGDRVTPRMVYKGFEGPKPSKFAGRAVTDQFLIDYHNQNGELLCEMDMFVLHYERGEGQKRAEGRKIELPHPWTKQELHSLEEEILAERPRGNNIRWWDDVNPGDEMESLIKGPIGLTDEVAFVATGAAPVPRLAAHGVALRRYRKQPKWAFRDPDTKALEPIYAVHYNKHAAQAMGVPVAYDVGVQRSCWHIHQLTNWMGDDGWLQEIEHAYRGFVYLSDVVRFGGRVVEKTSDGAGNYFVSLETWAVNQRGDNVMPGKAVVQLPKRGEGHPLAHK